jgi:hypothetical protein
MTMGKRNRWTPEERAEWEARYQREQRELAELLARREAAGRPSEERERYYAQRLAELERIAGIAPASP